MKKVALMTWFNHNNFGTVLQATAISKKVKDIGYDLRIINYTRIGFKKDTTLEKILNPQKIKLKVKNLIENRKYIKNLGKLKNEDEFNRFREKNLTLTREYETLSELNLLNDEFDAFICGSDQIWSPGSFDLKYYLNFVRNSNKIMSYAPSFGRDSFSSPYIKRRIKENLERFKFLSIREQQGVDLIKNELDINAKMVLDPTLLLTGKEWEAFMEPYKVDKPYLLVYFLGSNEKYWKNIIEISKKNNLKVIVIPRTLKDFSRGFDVADKVGPGEFLSLVKGANLVCTDSFHGTIFSILFKVSFLTYKRFKDKDKGSQNSRIYNLLNLFDLKTRLFDEKKFNINEVYIKDYTEAYQKIEKLKKDSLNYLKFSLEGIIESKENKEKYTITNTCCGCSICINVCPVNALSLVSNKNGFYNIDIDYTKCIECGKCKKVCAFNGDKGNIFSENNTSLYMGRSNSIEELLSSTSGAVAHEIGKKLSKEGYDIVGCTYSEKEKKAYHEIVKSGDLKSLEKFKGSKYIQSNTQNAVLNLLKGNKKVIFGTPCQIAGVSNFLELVNKRKEYILIDLICHGVPSKFLWEKYIMEGNKKYSYGLNPRVLFRSKINGWKNITIKIEGNKNKYTSNRKKDIFYKFFENQNCYMESCYECNFRMSSKADIRLGDYWGKKYDKYKKTGASMVLSLSENGEKILQELKKENIIELIREPLSDYVKVQFPTNPVKPYFYDEIIGDLRENEKNLKEILNKYFKIEVLNKELSEIYNKIRR